MRILIFNWRDITHPWAGGSEVNIHEMAKRWIIQGHKVTILCAQHYGNNGFQKTQETIDGINIIRVGGRYSVYIFSPIYYLLKLKNKSDLIIDIENGIPFFTPLFSRKPKCCLVNHVHRGVFFTELRFPLNIFGYFLETKLMPFLYRNVLFVTISKTAKEQLGEIGINRNCIKVVYPGIDHSVYKTGGKKFKLPTIIYLGRLRKYKRVGILLDLIAHIAKIIPDCRLFIVGDGDTRRTLEAKVIKHDLEKKVKILGYVNLQQKVDLLQRSWIYVTPSSMEGWGLTVLEANACGTPAIAFRVPGVSEAIRDNQSGSLVSTTQELQDRLINLLMDASQRKKLSEGAIKRAADFSWERSANKLLKILKDLKNG